MQSFLQNNKTLNFGPKTPYLTIFRQKVVRTTVTFEINNLDIVTMQSFAQNKQLKTV